MDFLARLCVLVVAAAVCVNAYSYTSSEISCNEGEDYIPDSEDCTKFWRCANGKPYSFTCPAGLHFNVDISVCDWPGNVRCGATSGEDSSDHSSDEDSNDDEDEHDDGSDDEDGDEETTYPYQPGPKYYQRKYYTENPDYFRPTPAPVYRPVPTRRPVYKPVYNPVYIPKPQTSYNSGQNGGGQTGYGSLKANEYIKEYINNNYNSGQNRGPYGSGHYKEYSENSNSNYNSNKNYNRNTNENYNRGTNYQHARDDYGPHLQAGNQGGSEKTVYGKPDFNYNNNNNYNFQPPAYLQPIQGPFPWQQQQQQQQQQLPHPYPQAVNNLPPAFVKQPGVGWPAPLPGPPAPGGSVQHGSDIEVGRIPVNSKPFEGPSFVQPYPVGGLFGQPLPLGKPSLPGQPFPIGKPIFPEQPFLGQSVVGEAGGIVVKPANPPPILAPPLPLGGPLGGPQVGLSSLGQAFIPVIQKDPQLARLYQQWNPVGPKGLPVSVDDYNMHHFPAINHNHMASMHMSHGVGPHGPTFFQPHHDPFAHVESSGSVLVVEPAMHGGASLSKILLPVKLVMTTSATTTTTATSTTTTPPTATTPTTATTTTAATGLPQGINIIILPFLPPLLPADSLPVPGTIVSEIPVGNLARSSVPAFSARSLLTNVLGTNQVTQGTTQNSPQNADPIFNRAGSDFSSTCTARRNSQLVVIQLAQQSGRTLPERKCSALGQLLSSFVMVYVENMPAQDSSPCVVEVPSILAQCNGVASRSGQQGQHIAADEANHHRQQSGKSKRPAIKQEASSIPPPAQNITTTAPPPSTNRLIPNPVRSHRTVKPLSLLNKINSISKDLASY